MSITVVGTGYAFTLVYKPDFLKDGAATNCLTRPERTILDSDATASSQPVRTMGIEYDGIGRNNCDEITPQPISGVHKAL